MCCNIKPKNCRPAWPTGACRCCCRLLCSLLRAHALSNADFLACLSTAKFPAPALGPLNFQSLPRFAISNMQVAGLPHAQGWSTGQVMATNEQSSSSLNIVADEAALPIGRTQRPTPVMEPMILEEVVHPIKGTAVLPTARPREPCPEQQNKHRPAEPCVERVQQADKNSSTEDALSKENQGPGNTGVQPPVVLRSFKRKGQPLQTPARKQATLPTTSKSRSFECPDKPANVTSQPHVARNGAPVCAPRVGRFFI